MAGQIETLQYENRQLKEQLRKFQEDVEFRLNEGKGGKAPSAAPSPGPAGTVNGGNPGSGRPGKRGDAFDPSQAPGAPGAPMQLGSTQPSAPLPPREAGARRAEAERRRGRCPAADPAPGRDRRRGRGCRRARLRRAGGPAARRRGPVRSRRRAPPESVAATRTGDPAADYDAAVELFRAKQYEQAEMGLRQFIQSHPRDNRVAGATYWLGESYLARGRNREAAEQFLKVSTDYARSAQAPDAMLKLGVTLNALGAREQACATLAELDRKFPNAGAGVRQGVAREQKRARCARLSGPGDPSDSATRSSAPSTPLARPGRPLRRRAVLLAVSGGPDSSALMQAAARRSARRGCRSPPSITACAPGSARRGRGRRARRRDASACRTRSCAGRARSPAAACRRRPAPPATRCSPPTPRRSAPASCSPGHTRDDQAETVLMRLAAGSGPAGLAGMRAERVLAPGIVLGRPFLHLPKATLVAWCEARGIPYVRDPSNADPRFARGRLRAAWPVLAARRPDPGASRPARRACRPRRGRPRGAPRSRPSRRGCCPGRGRRRGPAPRRRLPSRRCRTPWPCAASTSP